MCHLLSKIGLSSYEKNVKIERTIFWTNSVEQAHSCEADRRSARQEMFSLWLNSKHDYYVQTGQPLNLILRRYNFPHEFIFLNLNYIYLLWKVE
jgi:hypothetical protein